MATPHVTVRKHTPRRRRGMGSPRDGGAMQHAHRAYQPARPCGSRYLQHKWDKSDFERHRDKVKSAKATISTSPPRKYGHLEVKLKKLKLEEERVSKIQRDNHALLEKISRIMRTTGRVDHRNDYSSRRCGARARANATGVRGKTGRLNCIRVSWDWEVAPHVPLLCSLCSEKRHRELLQVTRENRALLERLSRCGSRYSVARWHEDWLRSNGYGDIIARYPRGALPEKGPCRGSKAAETAAERGGEKGGNFHSREKEGDKNESGAKRPAGRLPGGSDVTPRAPSKAPLPAPRAWGATAAMGCTPSKSGATYCQERACGDLDTCSTVVASAKSSLSTPEWPPANSCVETEGGKQTFLRVPSRSWHGRAPDACNELSAAASPGPDPASPARTPRAGPRASSSESDGDSSRESETPPRDQRR
ncbi:hypothetical protein Z043_116363 [Scleropages formosus]|uniref:Uncharacterized protein n=1 Tax=Scleropages formosus TaxID=113540 RepID=A0A0P7U655_SCLFO|nr:hypothetical protein Z043_116363 [Scleropages formosus]